MHTFKFALKVSENPILTYKNDLHNEHVWTVLISSIKPEVIICFHSFRHLASRLTIARVLLLTSWHFRSKFISGCHHPNLEISKSIRVHSTLTLTHLLYFARSRLQKQKWLVYLMKMSSNIHIVLTVPHISGNFYLFNSPLRHRVLCSKQPLRAFCFGRFLIWPRHLCLF